MKPLIRGMVVAAFSCGLIAGSAGCGSSESGDSSLPERVVTEKQAHSAQWAKLEKSISAKADEVATAWDPSKVKPGEVKIASWLACTKLSQQVEKAAGLKPSNGLGFSIGPNGKAQTEQSQLPRWIQDVAIYSFVNGLADHQGLEEFTAALVHDINHAVCGGLQAPKGEPIEAP